MKLCFHIRLIPLLFSYLIGISGFSQNNKNTILLDSLNLQREKDRGAFNLYITKTKLELIGGAYRNRSYPDQNFEPFTLTYHIYLPFQLELNRVNFKAGDKLMKINMPLIVHHSKYGNYALGLGIRFSFLIIKRLYLSYQPGLVWCEVVKPKTNDGFSYMGFNLHHEFNLSYNITKRIDISANLIHISNGAIFTSVKNNQDVIGIGLGYNFN